MIEKLAKTIVQIHVKMLTSHYETEELPTHMMFTMSDFQKCCQTFWFTTLEYTRCIGGETNRCRVHFDNWACSASWYVIWYGSGISLDLVLHTFITSIENKSEITISNWNKDKVSNSSDNPWNIIPSMSCALALLLLVQHCQLLQLAKRIEVEIEWNLAEDETDLKDLSSNEYLTKYATCRFC